MLKDTQLNTKKFREPMDTRVSMVAQCRLISIRYFKSSRGIFFFFHLINVLQQFYAMEFITFVTLTLNKQTTSSPSLVRFAYSEIQNQRKHNAIALTKVQINDI